MNRIVEEYKMDVALCPTSIASTAATGPYYRADIARKLCFKVSAGAMAVGTTVVAQVMQATNAAAGDAKVVTGAAATITANTKVKAAKFTLATFTAGSVVVVNGITFTAHASATTYADREFNIGGDDAADAAQLVLCINHATYGVSGVLASSAAGVVTLTCTEPGDNYLTIVGVTTIGAAATLYADAVVEIDASNLDVNNGFDHVALRITTDATILCSGELIRGGLRYNPTQYLAASTEGI
jgi:hypothetical protein